MSRIQSDDRAAGGVSPASDPPVRPLIEACVTTIDEAREVIEAGADRLELCRDLSTGGLTPPLEQVRAVRDLTDRPLMVMVRPRAGAFRMSAAELVTMAREMGELRAAGADGFVFGVLDPTGHIDQGALNVLVAAADGAPVTFHRAFDQTDNLIASLDVLLEAGVDRVLTGGGPGTAWEGREALAQLVRRAGNRLTILAGGGVRAGHVRNLVAVAGLTEVHARASAIGPIVRAFRGS